MILAPDGRPPVFPHEARDLRRVVLREALLLPRSLVDRRRRHLPRRDELAVLRLRHRHQIDPERRQVRGVAVLFAIEPVPSVELSAMMTSTPSMPACSNSASSDRAMYDRRNSTMCVGRHRQLRARRGRMRGVGATSTRRRKARKRSRFCSEIAEAMRANSGRYSICRQRVGIERRRVTAGVNRADRPIPGS